MSQNRSDRLSNRVAIVVGAGSVGEGWSNGRAAAAAYARAGAKVLAMDLDPVSLEATAAIVRDEGGDCEVFVGSATDSKAIAQMVSAVTRHWGRIDILHNNVGILSVGGPVEMEEQAWDRIVEVNLKSLFLTCKHVLPVMAAQQSGVITNIGSISGLRYTGVAFTAYSMTKGAVPAFTRSVALEYANRGIRANCIHPGVIDTPMQAATTNGVYSAALKPGEDLRKAREAKIPLGRYGGPFDIANAAVFLASDEAQYITGTELVVDGGFTSRAG